MPLVGTGFPNGVVTAPVGSTYIDTAATNGAIEWKKATGTGNTGWVVATGSKELTITPDLLLNGWIYKNTIDMPRILRRGNTVSVAIRLYIMSGHEATGNAFFELPLGFRPNVKGNYALLGTVTVTGPSGGIVALNKDFTRLSTTRNASSTDSVGGFVTYTTDDPWPTA